MSCFTYITIVGVIVLLTPNYHVSCSQIDLYFKSLSCSSDSGVNLSQMLFLAPPLKVGAVSLTAESALQCLARMSKLYDVTKGASSLMVLSYRKTNDASSIGCARVEPQTSEVLPVDADGRSGSGTSEGGGTADLSDMVKESCKFNVLSASSCQAFPRTGHTTMVLLTPWPDRQASLASCDLDNDDDGGGGWTVIQRRQDGRGQVSFAQQWQSYRTGFGFLSGEFWFGLENIRHLVSSVKHQIRFDVTTKTGEKRFAVYEYFHVAAEDDFYRLSLGGFSDGDAGDAFSKHDGATFSTQDKAASDEGLKCASEFSCGFWFVQPPECLAVNANGVYGDLFWDGLDGGISLAFFEMKIRPIGG